MTSQMFEIKITVIHLFSYKYYDENPVLCVVALLLSVFRFHLANPYSCLPKVY